MTVCARASRWYAKLGRRPIGLGENARRRTKHDYWLIVTQSGPFLQSAPRPNRVAHRLDFYTSTTVYAYASLGGRMIKCHLLAQFWGIYSFSEAISAFSFFVDKISPFSTLRATAKPRCPPAWFFTIMTVYPYASLGGRMIKCNFLAQFWGIDCFLSESGEFWPNSSLLENDASPPNR